MTGGPITDEDQPMVQAQIDYLETRLSEPERRVLNRRFEKVKQMFGGKHDPDWYTVLFRYPKTGKKGVPRKPNLRTLAKAVNRMDEYHLVYQMGSETSHATKSEAHVRVGPEGKLLILPLRDPSDFKMTVHEMVSIALLLYDKIYSEFRPEEAAGFWGRYKERWRPAIQSMPAINPMPEIHDIG